MELVHSIYSRSCRGKIIRWKCSENDTVKAKWAEIIQRCFPSLFRFRYFRYCLWWECGSPLIMANRSHNALYNIVASGWWNKKTNYFLTIKPSWAGLPDSSWDAETRWLWLSMRRLKTVSVLSTQISKTETHFSFSSEPGLVSMTET